MWSLYNLTFYTGQNRFRRFVYSLNRKMFVLLTLKLINGLSFFKLPEALQYQRPLSSRNCKSRTCLTPCFNISQGLTTSHDVNDFSLHGQIGARAIMLPTTAPGGQRKLFTLICIQALCSSNTNMTFTIPSVLVMDGKVSD